MELGEFMDEMSDALNSVCDDLLRDFVEQELLPYLNGGGMGAEAARLVRDSIFRSIAEKPDVEIFPLYRIMRLEDDGGKV